MQLSGIITAEDLKEPYDRMTDFLTMEEILRVADSFTGQQIWFRRECADIKTDYPELTALIGFEKAKIFIKMLGGSMGVYFPELRHSCSEKIKSLIKSEYNGYNLLHLAKRYGYTERHIRNIIGGTVGLRTQPDENQLSLFETCSP